MDYLLGHLVGDFLLQNDGMAEGKKRWTLVCLLHCVLYALSIFAFTGWPLWSLCFVVATHFVLDRWNFVPWFMRMNGQKAFSSPPMAPWSVIVVDNTFHLLTLYWINMAVGMVATRG